jgi:hypothetical protein
MTAMPPADICAVMCFFNPESYRIKRVNLELCRSHLESQKVPYFIVECSFTPSRFELSEAPNILRVNAHDIMWQKERLLNLVIKWLPRVYRKIAWIDGDVYLEDDFWHLRASDALESVAVLQPYSWSVRLPPGQTAYEGAGEVAPSFAYVTSTSNQPENLTYREHGRTGFAWAGRRDWLEAAGLYDCCIVGGGDHLMAHVFAAQFRSPCLGSAWGQGVIRSLSTWAEMLHGHAPGFKMGVTEGRLLHFWHGDAGKRQYGSRRALLVDCSFAPTADLRLGRSGVWEWASDKPDLHRGVRDYFLERAEDISTPLCNDRVRSDSLRASAVHDELFPSAENGPEDRSGIARDATRDAPSDAPNSSPPGWVIYKWDGGAGFMLPTLIPGAAHIAADPGDSVESVVNRIPPNTKVFAFHLDCTLTARFPLCRPLLMEKLQAMGFVILNRFILDISKRYVSDICERLGVPCAAAAMEDGDSSELLIVKTNLNHLGISEKRLRAADQLAMGLNVHTPLDSLGEYQVMCRCDIPLSWWRDPMLAIEKHVSNSAGVRYRCYFAGNNCMIATIVSREKISRFGNSRRLQVLCTTISALDRISEKTLPTSLQNSVGRFVEDVKADFGALDIVMDDESDAYIIDFNATPFTPKRDLEPEVVAYLREGLMVRAQALLRSV